MEADKKITPQQRYEQYRTNIVLRLNRRTDADILNWLEGQQNKQGTIKALIRAEIARESKANNN